MAFSVSLEAPCVSATVPLPPSFSPMAIGGIGAGLGDVLAGRGLQAGDRAFRRQHVPGDDREAFLAELADVREDRRIGAVDARPRRTWCGPGRLRRAAAWPGRPSWWRSDCRRLRRCSRAPCTRRGSPPASAGAPDGPHRLHPEQVLVGGLAGWPSPAPRRAPPRRAAREQRRSCRLDVVMRSSPLDRRLVAGVQASVTCSVRLGAGLPAALAPRADDEVAAAQRCRGRRRAP